MILLSRAQLLAVTDEFELKLTKTDDKAQYRSQLFGMGGGGGGKPPKCTDKYIYIYIHETYMRERAPQKHIYFQVSKYICIHIQSMPFPFITCGMVYWVKPASHKDR